MAGIPWASEKTRSCPKVRGIPRKSHGFRFLCRRSVPCSVLDSSHNPR